MTNANYRSSLGGACSAAGTTLMGIGVISQLNGSSTHLIQDITVVGFILTAAGAFFGHLFAADARSVANLAQDVQALKDNTAPPFPDPTPNTNNQSSNPMKKIVPLFLLITSLLCGLGTIVTTSGCKSSPNAIAYRVEATTRVTVQEALKFYNDQIVAPGKSTVAQETQVKAAYQKVQASATALCDAGKALSAASRESGTTTATELMAAFEQATSDFTQDKGDFLNLLGAFGVKFPGTN